MNHRQYVKKTLLQPVMKAVGLRIAVLYTLLALGALVIFSVIPFEKPLFVAMLLAYSLPGPFITPIYANAGENGEFISTALSAQTLVSLLLFVGVAAYSLA